MDMGMRQEQEMKTITVGELHDNLEKYLDEVRDLSGIIVMRNCREEDSAVILSLSDYKHMSEGS